MTDNIRDVFTKCIIRSDPVILDCRRKEFCSRCKIVGDHWTVSCPQKNVAKPSQGDDTRDIDSLVESYIEKEVASPQ